MDQDAPTDLHDDSIAAMQRTIAEQDQALAERQAQIAQLERRSRIDELLLEARTIDLHAARLLTEAAVQAMDEPDAQAAVDELKRTRPYLFQRAAPASGVMGPRGDEPASLDGAEHAAAEACATGRRDDLLRYLRLRRKSR